MLSTSKRAFGRSDVDRVFLGLMGSLIQMPLRAAGGGGNGSRGWTGHLKKSCSAHLFFQRSYGGQLSEDNGEGTCIGCNGHNWSMIALGLDPALPKRVSGSFYCASKRRKEVCVTTVGCLRFADRRACVLEKWLVWRFFCNSSVTSFFLFFCFITT